MAVSIVIPAYNEEGAIKSVVTALLAVMDGSGLAYEVIVVDDGSDDETAVIAESIPGITVLRHYQNKGYGASLKTGIRHACHDLICITDADGTYPNECIPELVHRLQKDDLAMVVGARTGTTVQIPWVRRPAKYILRTLANYLSGTKIPDLNSGLRVFKRDIALNYFRRLPSGFSFTTSITLAMLTNDYNVLFVPIDYFARTGQSKIRPIQDTINFFSLVVRMVLSYRPLRIFIPLAIFFSLLGTIKVIYDINVYDFHLATSTVVLLTLTFQIIILGLIADLVVSLHKS